MARILAISSYVASGHVGLCGIVPVLQAFGHEVISVPTVVLSCHNGREHVRGVTLEAGDIAGMLSALRANGTLEALDAVITGYMPSAEVTELVAAELERLAEALPDLVYLCDPVLGDDPDGLYVLDDVACTIRDRLLPLADIVCPNRFELAWLTGAGVHNANDADIAADSLGVELAVVTSVPAVDGQIANVSSDSDNAFTFTTPRLPAVPHGTGDVLAALLLGHVLSGCELTEATARASAGVQMVIADSIGAHELELVAGLSRTVEVQGMPGEEVGAE
ncbi:MAG: pyridoxal kinase [Hyphomicrobiaceae bacterium]|nr:pyridoxal kinase [Hyphomicrobiaceae bacterium]MCC0009387.1 pyridoxal kinase [Hyphomicrobiaceae bacterium]